ncbi:MAG: hypothetical protein LBT27_01375 [Prevotellaceae bacterium]|jgi:hypothetical protein|nr:hypothetical protein [Prevotellaceae bacterium]
MKKNVVIFIFIVISGKIAAQTEILQLPLPDTSKFMFDVKPPSPVNINFNIHKNPFPTTLTIQHEDLYLSKSDTAKQELLNEKNINPNLLFVRSVYFTGESPLFSGKTLTIGEKIAEHYSGIGEKISTDIAKEFKEKYLPLCPRPGKGLVIFSTKEERMKRRAEKRKTYVY